jgi:hypothetical protein
MRKRHSNRFRQGEEKANMESRLRRIFCAKAAARNESRQNQPKRAQSYPQKAFYRPDDVLLDYAVGAQLFALRGGSRAVKMAG